MVTNEDGRLEHLITTAKAAMVLGVQPATLSAWARRGLVPVCRLGRRAVRYSPSALRAWLAGKSQAGCSGDRD